MTPRRGAPVMIIVALLVTLFGCAETKDVTLFMQDLQIHGPIAEPPIHLTEPSGGGEIRIMPRFFFSPYRSTEGRIDGHTNVNGAGVFEVDTIYQQDGGVAFHDSGNSNLFEFGGRNLMWGFPTATVGLDADIGISSGVALSLGGHYSNIENEGVWGYRVGMGIRQVKESVAWRLDFGWQWETLVYDATTVITERPESGGPSTVYFYQDEGKSTTGRFFAGITINSANPDWTVKPFMQAALTNQAIAEVQPGTPAEYKWILPPFFFVPLNQDVSDKRGEFLPTFVHVTPGVFLNLNDAVRLVAGVRFSFETQIRELTRSTLIKPVVEIDWRL